MAICINRNGICFGNYSITPSTDGICISGAFSHQGTEINPTQAQGSSTGYATQDGLQFSFPFTSDTDASSTGATSPVFVCTQVQTTGASSTVSGYIVGGNPNPGPANDITIQKFPFASNFPFTDVGDLITAVQGAAGSTSSTHGYKGGGFTGTPGPATNSIEKFPFASDTNATDVGDLVTAVGFVEGNSSRENGYVNMGSVPGGSRIDNVQKYPFAADVNAVQNVTELSNTPGNDGHATADSQICGYSMGGSDSNNNAESFITSFGFVTDVSGGQIGNLSSTNQNLIGVSSTTSGYVFGGVVDLYEKFPFATDSVSVSPVGAATPTAFDVYGAGNQV